MFGTVEHGRIYIFYGKMGSGKTTNAMAQLLTYRKKGMTTWCNFPIVKVPPTKKDPPIYFEDDPAGILHMRDGLFVIDEAYMTLNARNWASLAPKVFTAFTHVRKLHMTIIVIAQSWMRIDKSIREVTSRARQFSGSSFFGSMYAYTEYEVDEMGEIIKAPPVEYLTASPGFSLIGRKVYEAFDTDFLFDKKPLPKEWESAIGYSLLPPEIEDKKTA